MKPFFLLYVKELKSNKILFLFLLLFLIGLNVYGVTQKERFFRVPEDESFMNFAVVVLLSPFTLVLSLPFLLAHAFNTEWKSETHYLMFALPVSQYKVILAKIAAVASIGFVGGGIVIGALYFRILADLRNAQFMAFDNTEIIRFLDFSFLGGSLGLVAYIVFILGLVTGMEGVKFSVKRYRGLTAIVFLIFALFVYGQFFSQGSDLLAFFGQISMNPSYGRPSQIELAPFAYTILMGIIFMILGLVVYEKRAEI